MKKLNLLLVLALLSICFLSEASGDNGGSSNDGSAGNTGGSNDDNTANNGGSNDDNTGGNDGSDNNNGNVGSDDDDDDNEDETPIGNIGSNSTAPVRRRFRVRNLRFVVRKKIPLRRRPQRTQRNVRQNSIKRRNGRTNGRRSQNNA